ncbi:50S ribosomal protein L6 [Candidatus Woesearchaeota archaeon]|nr:50S ribosomal protein L6 [Candidatus Woesearchaeota archaeon]
MKVDIEEKIEIPKDVQIKVDRSLIQAKGSKGDVSRKLLHPKIKISVQENQIMISSKKATKREKKIIGTFKAHLKNMLKGVVEPFVYKLKICSSHFPMTASVKDNEFGVQNFLGESIPRTLKLMPGVNVKVEGSEIIVESPDKELAGQTAASIEQLCKITNRDRRIFQDGIYIVSKSGKEIK